MKINLFNFCLILIFGLIFNMIIVSGFGIATVYSESYPLKIRAGDSRETFFLLSNTVAGDSDVTIRPELVQGFEIASLIEGIRNYNVNYGEEIEVPVRIEIPSNVEPGTKYKVSAMFRPSTNLAEQGNVQFLVNIGKSFPIIVVEDPNEIATQQNQIKGFKLTVEESPEDVVQDFGPQQPAKGNIGIWLGIIFVLILSILVSIVLIVYLVLRSRRMEREVNMAAGFVQQGNTQVYGNMQ